MSRCDVNGCRRAAVFTLPTIDGTADLCGAHADWMLGYVPKPRMPHSSETATQSLPPAELARPGSSTTGMTDST